MFTGIIEKTAPIQSLLEGDLKIRSPWNPSEISLGQSIAVDGCCLTVSHIESDTLSFHLSPETLQKTKFSTKQKNATVNLERCLKVGDRFDGHMVTGHVDALGVIESAELHADGVSKKLWIRVDPQFQTWIAEKGSIAMDGTSLTINDVEGARFSVTLIPHTLEVTTWKNLTQGDVLNIEFDMMAKYIDKALKARGYAV